MLPVNTFVFASRHGPTVFEQESENTYTDVNQQICFEAVKYALENEIFSGTGKNTFHPIFPDTRHVCDRIESCGH